MSDEARALSDETLPGEVRLSKNSLGQHFCMEVRLSKSAGIASSSGGGACSHGPRRSTSLGLPANSRCTLQELGHTFVQELGHGRPVKRV